MLLTYFRFVSIETEGWKFQKFCFHLWILSMMRGISKYKDSSASVQEVSHGRVGRHFSKSKQNYITIIEESCNYNINKQVVWKTEGHTHWFKYWVKIKKHNWPPNLEIMTLLLQHPTPLPPALEHYVICTFSWTLPGFRFAKIAKSDHWLWVDSHLLFRLLTKSLFINHFLSKGADRDNLNLNLIIVALKDLNMEQKFFQDFLSYLYRPSNM